jgi:tetratricopeptide (TPR) repeat protein
LRPDPRDRYPTATALANDLRRHVADLPLRGVPNRSPVERWRKWRRRAPQALSRNLILVAFLVASFAAGASLFVSYRQRLRDIDLALAEGRAHLDGRRFAEAARALRHGLALALSLPGAGRLKEELDEGLALASWNEKALELHRLAELIRLRYGLALPAREEALALIGKVGEIWQARGVLTRPPGGPGDSEVERTIKVDLLEVLTFWAELRRRLATPEDVERARREVDRVLAEAEAELGPSPTLQRTRREGGQGRAETAVDPASTRTPGSAWDFLDLGRRSLRSGELEQASRQLRAGLDLRPEDFWLNFYLGLCAYREKNFGDAVHAFHVCIALSPGTAECFYNRGLANEGLGQAREALLDYARALELKPGFTDAALNRGGLLYKQGRLEEAKTVLEQSRHSASPDKVGEIDRILALIVRARRGESRQ